MAKKELIEAAKSELIRIFGPESILAQAMEDEDFDRKFENFIAWVLGKVTLDTISDLQSVISSLFIERTRDKPLPRVPEPVRRREPQSR